MVSKLEAPPVPVGAGFKILSAVAIIILTFAMAIALYLMAEMHERREIAKCAASCPSGQTGCRDSKTDTEPPVCWCFPEGTQCTEGSQ